MKEEEGKYKPLDSRDQWQCSGRVPPVTESRLNLLTPRLAAAASLAHRGI